MGAGDSQAESPQPMIGVTGHLILSGVERGNVERQALAWLRQLLASERSWTGVRLLSGLAPGADLVLTQAVLDACRQAGVACHLTAAIVGSVEQLLEDWRNRMRSLEIRIDAATEQHVERVVRELLARADRQLFLVSAEGDGALRYRELAALLAESTDILLAVVRPGYVGQPGGSQEVLAWWRQPQRIPAHYRLGRGTATTTGRKVLVIDPGNSGAIDERALAQSAESAAVEEVRDRLRAGNPLSASDAAARALDKADDSLAVRYWYLLSLAASGATGRALRRYDELAPPEAERNEDWRALKGRLHKDLAFAGIDIERNLRLAARHYADAFAHSAGEFSGVNAASLALLAGQRTQALRLARKVRAMTQTPPTGADARALYYSRASAAEASAVLGDLPACAQALSQADPLLRGDLMTRSRTRDQIARVLRARGDSTRVIEALAMPQVYVLEPVDVRSAPALPDELASALRDSPVYVMLGGRMGVSPGGTDPLNRLLDAGVRLNLVHPGTPHLRVSAALRERAEHITPMTGFLADETPWRLRCAQRLMSGLARLDAQRLGVAVRTLALRQTSRGRHWVVDDEAPQGRPRPPARRCMVGLVFTDMVGFSVLDDNEILAYWTVVVPALQKSLRPFAASILLQRTWGDALHLVTLDAQSSVQVADALLQTVVDLRRRLSGKLARLEIRVGVHFAPAWRGEDAVQSARTYYGSQLSFAARVEPVTPPGTAYVTEACAAELAAAGGAGFRVEYAGEVPLAKRYGTFRLYALHRSDAQRVKRRSLT
ncbi:MAG TPA: tetratricopeptide repeat-containing protein [Fontimonas sp.]